MAKFLIQDIMPPEKRRPRAHGSPHLSDPVLQNEKSSHAVMRHEKEDHVIHSHKHDSDASDVSAYTKPSEESIPEQGPWVMPSGPSRWGWSNSDLRLVPPGGNLKTVLKAVLICFLILGGYVTYATLTSKAEVLIVPRTEMVSLPADSSFAARKDPGAGELGYSVMRFSLSEKMEIPATGSKEVSEKASGRIIIYNEFSTASQRLIKNTRFESPGGKIYRINESVTVPGMKKDGVKIIPGSIEVTVYADEPGPAYNSEPTDFTIPGFKSDAARYKGFYARSVGPISGGMSGTVRTVSDADLQKAADDLRVALETSLRTKARGNLGKDQVLFDSGIMTSFANARIVQTDEKATPDKAIVERTATLAAVVFDEHALAREIARTGLGANYRGERVSLLNAADLTFTMEQMGPDALFESSELLFGLAGEAKLIWNIDSAAIAELLQGAEERVIPDILAKADGSIDKAIPNLRPFWRSSYPDDPREIIVTIQEPQ